MRLDDIKIGERLYEEPITELMIDMEKNGQTVPVIVSSDGWVVDGVARCLAAKSLGWEEIWVVVRPREKF